MISQGGQGIIAAGVTGDSEFKRAQRSWSDAAEN
jgi:hypothetical protein